MKTVSKDLAIKLRENGYPQESYFWWIQDNGYWHKETIKPEGIEWENFQFYASPTADELIETFPTGVSCWMKGNNGYEFEWYAPSGKYIKKKFGSTLADACALMYIFLKEQSLISQKEKI